MLIEAPQVLNSTSPVVVDGQEDRGKPVHLRRYAGDRARHPQSGRNSIEVALAKKLVA